jgi:excisionase family DNA binding protein
MSPRVRTDLEPSAHGAPPPRTDGFALSSKPTNGSELSLAVPGALVEALAERVVDRLAERLPDRPEPWLESHEAADYLRTDAKRISALVRSGQLRCARDGRRLLFKHSWLDKYVDGGGP